MEEWKCPKCGVINPGKYDECGICKSPRIQGIGFEKIVCPNCGREQPGQTNHCSNCGKPTRISDESQKREFQKITDPPSILCFAVKATSALIFAKPDPTAERLYVIGPGDICPIIGEDTDYYFLLLPGEEKGFVPKITGFLVDVGLDEVKEPLGYVRNLFEKNPAEVFAFQPSNGETEVIHVLKVEDRLPVIEEREDYFGIQLPNKFRGFTHKANVIRTLLASSLPTTPSSGGLADFALGAAALIGLGIIGELIGNPEEARIRREVDRAMRERGI